MSCLLARCLAASALLAALASPAAAQRAARLPSPFEFQAEAYFAETTAHPMSIGSVRLSGRFLKSLVSGETSWALGIGVDYRRCQVYMPLGTALTGGIARVSTRGTGLTTILSHPGYGDPLRFMPAGVALDLVDDRIYWISPAQANRIGSCSLNGSDPRPAVFFTDMTPQVLPRSIHVDAKRNRIYWYDTSYQGFRRADVDSSGNPSNLTDVCFIGTSFSRDVDVVNEVLYWTVPVGATHELRKAPIPTVLPGDLSTSGYTVFANETDGVRGFVFDVLSVSPEVGVVAWVSFTGELSWKPINGTLATPNRRSPTLSVTPRGSLEVVPGPYVCIRFP